jgi:hypothetical protein
MKTCVLCNKQFDEFGNNPSPLATVGLCCNECDDLKVTPARMVKRGIEPNVAAELGRKMFKAMKKFKASRR